MTTHSLSETATATRIESMAKTMSVSSTFTTVAQNGDSPSHGSAGLIGVARLAVAAVAVAEVLERQVQQIQAADQLHPAERDEVRRQRRWPWRGT